MMKLDKIELTNVMKDLKKVAAASRSKAEHFHIVNDTIVYNDERLAVFKTISEKMEGDTLSIPFKQFNQLLTKSKAASISFSNEDNFNVVILGDNKVSYPATELEAPQLEAMDNYFSITFKELKDLLINTLYASSLQESRPVLTGVRLALKDNKINAATTDSHRLATNEIELQHDFNTEIVVPSKELKKVLSMDFKEDLKISFSEKNIQITDGHTVAQINLLDGHYPSIERLIPTNATTTITTNRLKLIEALEMAKVFNNDNKFNVASFETDNDYILRAYNENDQSRFKSALNAKIEGDPLKISFNETYLLEALKNTTGDLVTLGFTSPIRPFTIKSDTNTTLHLVTPVRTY